MSRECHNHKPQPFQDPKRKRKPTNLNKHKSNKRTKSTKISSLFPKRGNRNTKRTEKHKNKMTHWKTYNNSPRRINHKATRSKTNTGTTALERSVEQTTGGVKALLQLANFTKKKKKKVREKSRECHNHKPQPFPDPKRKRKPTNLNKHKPNKRTKSAKISSLFPKRGNRNTKRTEKHKNKMTHWKTYNKSPRRINHKAKRSKTNTGTTALERSVEQTTGGFKALLQLANFTLGPDATLYT